MMRKDIDKKIEAIYEQKRLKAKIELHIKVVQKKIRLRKKELKTIEYKLEQTEYSIEALEKLSIRSLFLKALGNKQQQLERVRQNYLMNFLKYKSCKERIESKTFEVKVLKEKLLTMEAVDAELKELLQYKKNYIKYKNKTVAKEVIRLENRIRIFQYKRKEIEEALASGRKAIVEVRKLMRALKKIESWHTVIDSKGQMFSSYKGKMFAKNVLKEVKTVSAALDDYIDELLDVSQEYHLDYEQFIHRIEEFLENFYDGLISDWIFHKEIKISINLVLETIDKIKRIQAMLENDAADSLEEEVQERAILDELLVKTKLN